MRRLIPYVLISFFVLVLFFAYRESALHDLSVSNLSLALEEKDLQIRHLESRLERSAEAEKILATRLAEEQNRARLRSLSGFDSAFQDYFATVRKNYGDRSWWKDSKLYERYADFAVAIVNNAAGSYIWNREESRFSAVTNQNSYVLQNDRLDALIAFAGIEKSQSSEEKLRRILDLLQQVSYEEDLNNEFRFPLETLNLRSGDCDDFSILAASFLKRIGIPVAIVFVSNEDGTSAHAWLAVQGSFNLPEYDLSAKGIKGDWLLVEPQLPYERQFSTETSKYPRILAAKII